MTAAEASTQPIEFQTHPDRYRHWQLKFDGDVAQLDLNVQPDHPFKEGYELKLNSYDLGVDIELADAMQRIRFEHPEVKVVRVGSAVERVFCAGANIGMLASSTHPFKVNFCKYTNETRLSLEDASRHSNIDFVAALNGTCAGGGYELALACDEIYLVDDGNSVVSLPEVPLLGVLPGTGGLTRLVDKRKVRRDLADMFSTLEEGAKGRKAKAWRLIDDAFPRSKFEEKVSARMQELASKNTASKGAKGITLNPLKFTHDETGYHYEHVELTFHGDKRVATLTIKAPTTPQPKTAAEFEAAGDNCWALQCFRELDDLLCHLRFEHEEIGLLLLKTTGKIDDVLAVEKTLWELRDHWLVNEINLQIARTMRRYELTGRSLFALIEQGSCFGGLFYELALASDRIYMLDDPDSPLELAVGAMSSGALPMSNGLTRLQSRFLAEPDTADAIAKEQPRLSGEDANDRGLVTAFIDDLDWDDDVRIAIEERASLSPDALTGMEASLRFGGPETCDSKIFGRLSAWQNWIFIRPNATGEEGALTRYGQPEAARFDWRRT